jgi:hypothetical protein
MNLPKLLTFCGLALCLLGTFLVAIELVIRFKGYAFEIKSMTYNGQGKAEKTAGFERWETKRAKFMWSGLALITIGTAAQMVAICVNA